ncbi:MAG: hypothetical protein HYX56_01400 [Chloroflexi bacterium]|nr:hypothetical protein [Chloroflexota bacterium]
MHRLLRLGTPLGVFWFAALPVLLAEVNLQGTLFVMVLCLISGLTGGVALSTAHAIEVVSQGLRVRQLVRSRTVTWSDIVLVEKAGAYQNSVVRVVTRAGDFLVFRSISDFDRLILVLELRSPVALSRMPTWRRLLVLK